MKKLTLLILSTAGIGLAACNGGGSSSSGGSGGGSSGDACSNGAASCGTPANQVPESYSQVITPAAPSTRALTTPAVDGTLKSTTNLYLSSTESYPLSFTVTGNTTEITVNFSIVADDLNIPAGSPLPSITPQQCIFAVSNPAPCNLVITLGNAPVGQYKVVPQVVGGAEFSTAVVMNFLPPTQFTLPLGTYLLTGSSVSPSTSTPGIFERCEIHTFTTGTYYINTPNRTYYCDSGLATCTTSSGTSNRIPTTSLPAGTIYHPATEWFPAYYVYLTNAGWNGSVFTSTNSNSVSVCSGLFATSTMTFQSSSTTPMYPVVYY